MRYLLDTNTCIAAMRKSAAVVKRLSAVVPGECAISTITSYELYTVIAKCNDPEQELSKVNLLLATISQLMFDVRAAREASRIRAWLESQGCMIGPYDVLLAGHAVAARLTLVTANTGEFSKVADLNLENWQVPLEP